MDKKKRNYYNIADTHFRNECIMSNLGLVVAIAKRFEGNRLPLEDLIQEGCIGLIYAYENFDWEYENNFTTYAYYWIHISIVQAVTQKSRIVRIPDKIVNDLSRILKYRDYYFKKFGKNPSLDDISNKTHIKKNMVIDALMIQNMRISIDKVEFEDTKYPDDIIGKKMNLPDIEIEENEIIERIEETINEILPSEKSIIYSYFGLDGPPSTFHEIGEQTGISGEWVRQIFQKSLNILKLELSNLANQ